MFDEPICLNCQSWNRTGSGYGYCTDEKSEEFERVTYGNHVCMPPFKGKF